MNKMHLQWIKILVLTLTLLINVCAQADGKLIKVAISGKGATSRANFFLSQPTDTRVYLLTNPHRLAIDFPTTTLATNLQKIPLQSSLFKDVRSGYPRANILRLVFDLKKPVHFKLSSQPTKVMLDIYGVNLVQDTKNNSSIAPIHRRQYLTAEKIKPAIHPITIVIDPGHGGQDPGAVGEKGTQEKQVVLAISKQLATLINQQTSMRAVLTRHSDVFVPLIQRLKLSRKGKADLFIAIHADSYFNAQSTGASVYALSRRGATSIAAKWLSDRENHSELGGLNLRELEDQSVQLRSVLIDLAQTATTIDSLRLGTSMLKSLDNVTNLHYSRVEQAPFLVLKSPDIPSILVETGFLSNPKEEEKLRNPAYQHKIAEAIFNGIQLYLKKYSTAQR